MITLMGNTLLRNLLIRVREACWYLIIADETRDISNKEQLTVTIRWVSDTYEVQEDLIGMIHVPSTTASTLTATIKDVLIRCILPLSNCRGQAYDGAANMMGHLRGVATVIENEHPSAIKVHCFAHCLNLCLQDAAKKCQPVRNALDVTMELSKLILYSPKRTLIFQSCKQALSPEGTGLRPLCPTRWTVRTEAINAVLKNYAAIVQALEQISEESHDNYGRRANGLLSQLERFDTFIGLKLSHLVFSGTEQTSINLQKKDTSVQEALACVDLAISYLKRLRTDDSFRQFYSSAVQQAEEFTSEPSLPRYRRPPKRLDDGSAPHSFKSPEDYYRSHYFYVLDLISEEISDRFKQSSMLLPKEMENLLFKAANNADTSRIEVPEAIISMYHEEDIHSRKLDNQLQMLPDLVNAFKKSQNLPKLTVTKVSTIADMLVTVPMAKDMFSEIDKILQLYLTIPVTTCTAERSFSSLRRIKTYLRSTMSEERLNNILLLHVHKEETDTLDLTEIARLFVSANTRREDFFGKFA